MKKDSPARWWLAGTVLVALIAGAVTLSAMGRPLIDLLALVSLVVLPIMGAMGYTIKEQTNGNTTTLLGMVQQHNQATLAAREQEKAELLTLVREALAAQPPAPPAAPVSPPAPPTPPDYRQAA